MSRRWAGSAPFGVGHLTFFWAAGRSTIPRPTSRWIRTSRLFSPYDLNVIGWNPLQDILTEGVDFERVAQSPIKRFLAGRTYL